MQAHTKLDLEIEERKEKLRKRFRFWEPIIITLFVIHFLAGFLATLVPLWIVPAPLVTVLFFLTLACLYFLVLRAFRYVPAGPERKRAYLYAMCCLISLIMPGYSGSALRQNLLSDSVEVIGEITDSEIYEYRLRYGREHLGHRVYAKFAINGQKYTGLCDGCPLAENGTPVVLGVSQAFHRVFAGKPDKTRQLWKRKIPPQKK